MVYVTCCDFYRSKVSTWTNGVRTEVVSQRPPMKEPTVPGQSRRSPPEMKQCQGFEHEGDWPVSW